MEEGKFCFCTQKEYEELYSDIIARLDAIINEAKNYQNFSQIDVIVLMDTIKNIMKERFYFQNKNYFAQVLESGEKE